MTVQDYYKKIKILIAHKAGVDPEEVDDDMYFEDDLNIGALELAEILSEIEEEFNVQLLDQKENIETVQDLLDIVTEQVE